MWNRASQCGCLIESCTWSLLCLLFKLFSSISVRITPLYPLCVHVAKTQYKLPVGPVCVQVKIAARSWSQTRIWVSLTCGVSCGVSVSVTGVSGFFNLHLWVENNAGPQPAAGGQVWADKGISAWNKTWGYNPYSRCQLLGKMSACIFSRPGGGWGVCVNAY